MQRIIIYCWEKSRPFHTQAAVGGRLRKSSMEECPAFVQPLQQGLKMALDSGQSKQPHWASWSAGTWIIISNCFLHLSFIPGNLEMVWQRRGRRCTTNGLCSLQSEYSAWMLWDRQEISAPSGFRFYLISNAEFWVGQWNDHIWNQEDSPSAENELEGKRLEAGRQTS
jgi:hypothetical protein